MNNSIVFIYITHRPPIIASENKKFAISPLNLVNIFVALRFLEYFCS